MSKGPPPERIHGRRHESPHHHEGVHAAGALNDPRTHAKKEKNLTKVAKERQRFAFDFRKVFETVH